MKILVTGNLGYVGSVLTPMLVDKGHKVAGLDTKYYEEATPLPKQLNKVQQITKDVRDVSHDDLGGIDSIIHLAALSNDPLGEFDIKLTRDINFVATIKLARLAKKVGVKRFVYASTQSIYGISKTDKELKETDRINPVTAYAKSKWDSECELKKLVSNKFCVICFRPSTIYGASPMLRCDIVFNNLVACAYTTGTVEIKSDGTPWRPVNHILDVCSAFIAGLEAPKKLVENQSFNIGEKRGNYTVKQLAEAAQGAVPGSVLVYTGEHGKDSRTYRISFDKIHTVLKDHYKPCWNLNKGGKELINFYKKIKLTEKDFRGRKYIRLEQLKYLIKNKKIGSDLRWLK